MVSAVIPIRSPYRFFSVALRVCVAGLLIFLWHVNSTTYAAMEVVRPAWNVGDTWKFRLCAEDQLGGPFRLYQLTTQYRYAYYIRKVLGKGSYLGLGNVYTVEQTGWAYNLPAPPIYEAYDYDLNLLAIYDPHSGSILTRVYNNKANDWPLFAGKSWSWEGYQQPRGGPNISASGTVAVSGLVFGGKEYVRLVSRIVQRWPDRETIQTTLVIRDEASRTVLVDFNPKLVNGEVTPSVGASCLDGHPIRALVVGGPQTVLRLPSLIDMRADRVFHEIPPGNPDAVRAGTERELQRLQRLPLATQTQIRLLVSQGDEAIQEKDWRRCENVYIGLLVYDPNNYTALFNLAACSYNLGVVDTAIDWAIRAISQIPDPGLYFTVASCYVKKQDPDRAFAWLERALQGGFRQLSWIENNFAPYRDDPRYQKIVGSIR